MLWLESLLLKKNGYKGGDIIGGKSGPIMESTSIGDFVNRLARNYTVDVGDATSRTIQDTFLGGKGKSNVLDYSLVKPDTGFGILDAAIKYNPTNLLAGNLLNNSDFSQILAPGDVVPVQKVASLGLKGVKASPNILKGIKMAAERTSPDVLSAASGGLLRGSPVRAARGAPEPDEFDKIINAAKAEDPTLGDVAPEGTAPAPFRSEADWDESMSVNYKKARQKIIYDLEDSIPIEKGDDFSLLTPIIDDSIAALDSEIGNLTMARYNHNDLEDFLGRVAAPDDYTVADSSLAKRADELVREIGNEATIFNANTEQWLLDTQFNMDAAAKKAVKSGTARLERQGPEDLLSNPGGPAPSSNNPAAPRGKFEGMPKDPFTGEYLLAPSEQRFASGGSVLARAESQTLTNEAARLAVKTAMNRLKIKFGRRLTDDEREIIKRKAKESYPEFLTAYENFASHPDNYDRINMIRKQNKETLIELQTEIDSFKTVNAKGKLKAQDDYKKELDRQNTEFAQAHDPSTGVKDNIEAYLSGETSIIEGVQVTSKNANDLDNAATQRYDKLFRAGDSVAIGVQFPNGKPDSWDKIIAWGIKNHRDYKKYFSMPDGLNQMRYDLYLTHLI
jgi:hypothetical protein